MRTKSQSPPSDTGARELCILSCETLVDASVTLTPSCHPHRLERRVLTPEPSSLVGKITAETDLIGPSVLETLLVRAELPPGA